MKMKRRLITCLLPTVVVLSSIVTASEMVYTPVNPSFGGNPLNANQLLSSASSQNDLTDPNARVSGLSSLSSIDRFAASLESRLLSQLLSDINDGTTGSLTTDDFTVNVQNFEGTITVDILDLETGESTQIVVGTPASIE